MCNCVEPGCYAAGSARTAFIKPALLRALKVWVKVDLSTHVALQHKSVRLELYAQKDADNADNDDDQSRVHIDLLSIKYNGIIIL